MAEITFNKHKKQSQTKDIPETKAAKPKKKFSLDDMPTSAQPAPQQPANDSNSVVEEQRHRRPGRRRTSILTAVVRVNDDNLSKINALKETMSLDSQDDVITQALELLLRQLDNSDRRVYEALLEVQKRKIRKRHRK